MPCLIDRKRRGFSGCCVPVSAVPKPLFALHVRTPACVNVTPDFIEKCGMCCLKLKANTHLSLLVKTGTINLSIRVLRSQSAMKASHELVFCELRIPCDQNKTVLCGPDLRPP